MSYRWTFIAVDGSRCTVQMIRDERLEQRLDLGEYVWSVLVSGVERGPHFTEKNVTKATLLDIASRSYAFRELSPVVEVLEGDEKPRAELLEEIKTLRERVYGSEEYNAALRASVGCEACKTFPVRVYRGNGFASVFCEEHAPRGSYSIVYGVPVK